ncbi:MAG: galactose mutarotase [Balneola sp.]|nr:MAG: galactose mutarotase [Balneola sp.]
MSTHSTKTHYGTLPDGTPIHQFTLTNKNGVELKAIEYGGIITHLFVPDKHGVFEDIVLGHDSLKNYLNSPYFLGALIGRYGNRIAGASFELDGITYQLEKNDGENNLHGGDHGFHTVVWKGKEISSEKGKVLELSYTSPDGEEGFPGALTIRVIYTLTDEDTFEIEYRATTDKKTIINLSQHSYFNLSGMKEDILGHELSINADRYVEIKEGSIPTGRLEPVSETPFDFRTAKEIGVNIEKDHPQLRLAGGFDFTWVLNNPGDMTQPMAVLSHQKSGRMIEVYTTEPGIQFYSGNALANTPPGKKGGSNHKHMGLCLETQHFPDSPNQPHFPSVELDIDQVYSTTTIYKFSISK